MPDSKQIFIKTEDEAWDLLQKAIADELPDGAHIEFQDWPEFKLTIKGKDYDCSIPTRIMPPILELQREIHRVYCDSKYGPGKKCKLNNEERDFLELIVDIKPGSSKYITKLFNVLNKIIKNSNMSGTQITILVLGLAGLIATDIGWKEWLDHSEKVHRLDSSVRLSDQESKRLQLLADALSTNKNLRDNHQAISKFKRDISKRLKPSDQLQINDTPIINGSRASEITAAIRRPSDEIRLDGEFIINDVRFPEKFGGKYRFSVTRKSDDTSLHVEAAPDKLSPNQIAILKDGGFDVKPVRMKINARRTLSGRITSANLVSINWPGH